MNKKYIVMTNDERREHETERSIVTYMNERDTFKEEFAPDGADISMYYVDQKFVQLDLRNVRGPMFQASYTSYGIQQIDSWLSKQIQYLPESKFSPNQLKKMIRRNPHLHNVIKTNLLSNLKNVV